MDKIEVIKAKRYMHYRVREGGPTERVYTRPFNSLQYPDIAKGAAVPELYALRIVNELNQVNAAAGFIYWLQEEA